MKIYLVINIKKIYNIFIDTGKTSGTCYNKEALKNHDRVCIGVPHVNIFFYDIVVIMF